jgi:hypothetical protein
VSSGKAFALVFGSILVVAVGIGTAVALWQKHMIDETNASIEVGYVIDSNGNHFRPKYKCFYNSGCVWVLTR